MKDHKRKLIRVFFSLILGSLATILFGCGRTHVGTLLLGWSGERIETEISDESGTALEGDDKIGTDLKDYPEVGTKDGSDTDVSSNPSENTLQSLLTKEENGTLGFELLSGKDGEPGSGQASASILVHVCGAVNTSGVYAIPEGGRVIDAVEAAGGFAADAAQDYINMAQVLYDGSKVIIPTLDEVADEPLGKAEFLPGTASTEREGGSDEERKININTASAEELMKLPGVGQTRAEAIIAYRRREGAFTCAEDLTKVSGIGENTFLNLKDLICIE